MPCSESQLSLSLRLTYSTATEQFRDVSAMLIDDAHTRGSLELQPVIKKHYFSHSKSFY